MTKVQTCSVCGMQKEDWSENNGRGYKMNDEFYCCRGCAEGTGCTCSLNRATKRTAHKAV